MFKCESIFLSKYLFQVVDVLKFTNINLFFHILNRPTQIYFTFPLHAVGSFSYFKNLYSPPFLYIICPVLFALVFHPSPLLASALALLHVPTLGGSHWLLSEWISSPQIAAWLTPSPPSHVCLNMIFWMRMCCLKCELTTPTPHYKSDLFYIVLFSIIFITF